jgi:hypothetical protein
MMNAMNTGTCKKTAGGLAALMMLSACAEGPALNLLPQAEEKPLVPLIKAQMVEGAVTLVPPAGYCIEPSSLTQDFALMARCDLLKAKGSPLGAPIGLITASFAQNRGDVLNAADVAIASDATVVETFEGEDLSIVRAQTQTPPNGQATTHFRAATKIEDYDLSLALFSPAESEAQGAVGASLLRNLVRSSKAASMETNASELASTTGRQKKGFGATLSGLFK